MSRSPLCVYTANNVEEADIVTAWLAEQDIEAMVPDRHAIGATTFGLPAFVPGGIEVCVTNADEVDLAQALLEKHAEAIQTHVPSDGAGQDIAVVCENCHETISFPHSEAGSVAECPNCREYIDVPDLDAD